MIAGYTAVIEIEPAVKAPFVENCITGWYFKIHQNITSRHGAEWYLGSFEISRASIYPKYPKETDCFLFIQGKEISHFT